MSRNRKMPFDPDVAAFVQAAVRLPHDRLRRIDRHWDRLTADRRVVSELVQQAGTEVRLQVEQLRDYIMTAARMAAATGESETGSTALLAEEIAEAVLPAARAVLLRQQLEGSTTPGRSAAFAALTAPFLDVMPRREGGKE